MEIVSIPSRISLRLKLHRAGAAFTMALAIWLSSGTMAPYAATADVPVVLEPCHYLLNVDHLQFVASYRMLSGLDRETWAGSVVLRRILFPIIAYPFVMTLGMMAGGVLASALVNVAGLLAFTSFCARNIGERGAIAVAWLIATYPGVTYWAGLPYSYAAIVPACLVAMMLLYALRAAPTVAEVFRRALFLGIVFLAYDLLPFFGPAAVLMLLRERKWRWIPAAVVALLLPTLVVAAAFMAMGVPLINTNTASYVTVLLSYVQMRPGWSAYLLALPRLSASNFLFSNFVFIPILFLGAALLSRVRRLHAFALPDVAVIIAVTLVFLVNNAAPAYFGWQLRGEWIARLYQPIVVAFLPVIARVTDALQDRGWRLATGLTVLLNASVVFGPVLGNPVASWMYYRFYIHSQPDALMTNIERYGKRPLGFCRTSHEFDDLPNPATPSNRPAYMYRYPGRDTTR